LQKIIISPIENIDICNYQLLGQEIHRTFGFQTESKSLLQNINFAYNLNRGQYHSTAILEKLANTSPSEAFKIAAITDKDLFIPILTHVYGEAQLAGKACIVSTFRLKEGLSIANIEKGLGIRIVKEVLHELGHTFNLCHCRDNSCIMHYCRSMRDVDRKSNQLCRYCKILLEDELKKMKK
jgi:archaemetzincin